MMLELRENFKIILDGARQAGIPTESLEAMMIQVLHCLNSVQGEDERLVLLTEMQVLINAGLTSKLDDVHYRKFNNDVGFILIGCIMTLLKEFSHGDLS